MKKYVMYGVAGLYIFSAINSMHAMLTTRSARRFSTAGQKRGYSSSWFSLSRKREERELKEEKRIEAEEAIRKEYEKVGLRYKPPVVSEFKKEDFIQPQKTDLMTRIYLGWENVKGFFFDVLQTQQMRDAKKKAASDAQEKHMEEINKLIAAENKSRLELEKAKRAQAWTQQLEESHQERIAAMRKEAEIARRKERDELIKKRAQEIEEERARLSRE